MEKTKVIDTLSDYMNDETRVSPAERERINFEISLIGKIIEAREIVTVKTKQASLSKRSNNL